MKNHDLFPASIPRVALIFLFAFTGILVVAIPPAAADYLQPGTYGQANGWTLSLRAERYTGARPMDAGTGMKPSITDDPWMYPVIVLNGPMGVRYEYSLLSGTEVSPLIDLRLELDWDGDGNPEVYYVCTNPLVIGGGSKPMGGGGSAHILLRPSPEGDWKSPILMPSGFKSDEDGSSEEFFCVSIDGKTMPRLRVWSIRAIGGTQRTLYFDEMVWQGKEYRGLSKPLSWEWGGDTNGEGDTSGPILRLIGDQVNMRAAADLGSAVVGLLPRGTFLEFLDIDGRNSVVGTMRAPWIRVKVSPDPLGRGGPLTGKTGWVFGLFVGPVE